jgi:hypothetical protein
MGLSTCGLVLYGFERDFEWSVVNVGLAGGGKIEDYVGTYILACTLRNVVDNLFWAFGVVYGPNDDGERRYMWDELVGLMSW